MECKNSAPGKLVLFPDTGMFCRFSLRLPRSLASSVIPRGQWSQSKARVLVLEQKAWCFAAGELMLSTWPQCLKWSLQKKLEWVMLVLPWQQIMIAGRNMKKQWVELFSSGSGPERSEWEPVGFKERSHSELNLFLHNISITKLFWRNDCESKNRINCCYLIHFHKLSSLWESGIVSVCLCVWSSWALCMSLSSHNWPGVFYRSVQNDVSALVLLFV